VKALLVYLAATQRASPQLQRKVAQTAILNATAVGILLLVAGALFMRLLHFSEGALMVAGGLILLLLALNVVLSAGDEEAHGESPNEEALLRMAVYPLGIPVLLNPIGIVALTVFSAETDNLLQIAIILGMLLVVAAIDYGIFLAAHRLGKHLTRERILVLKKLLGILLAALAVQLMLNGLANVGVIDLVGH
jgi:small neutral amino acid transporter SnatA (MarC family)